MALDELHLLPGSRALFLRNSALSSSSCFTQTSPVWPMQQQPVESEHVGCTSIDTRHVSTAIHSQMQVNLTLKPSRLEETDWNN